MNRVRIDRASFDSLLQYFSQNYAANEGGRGRPRKKTNAETLGILLQYFGGTMLNGSLCLTFGVPPASLSRMLTEGTVALLEALRSHPDARITWPSKRLQRKWAELAKLKEPLIENVWGFVDGKNLRVQSPSPIDLQNAYYSGIFFLFRFK